MHLQPLDFNDSEKVWGISQELLLKSHEYAKARMDYAEAKFNYDLMLARELPLLRQKKSNIGVETAQIMVLEVNNSNIQTLYKNLLDKENLYKGYEKILDALKTQITLFQSIAKTHTNQGA